MISTSYFIFLTLFPSLLVFEYILSFYLLPIKTATYNYILLICLLYINVFFDDNFRYLFI